MPVLEMPGLIIVPAVELEAWGAAELMTWGAAELMALSSARCAAVAVAEMDEGVPMMVLAEQWG